MLSDIRMGLCKEANYILIQIHIQMSWEQEEKVPSFSSSCPVLEFPYPGFDLVLAFLLLRLSFTEMAGLIPDLQSLI